LQGIERCDVKVGKMTEVVAGLIGEALSAEVHNPESATVLSVKGGTLGAFLLCLFSIKFKVMNHRALYCLFAGDLKIFSDSKWPVLAGLS
jgi:hypothetical protein